MDFSTIKKDFSSSIVVFLVALPLCLGVALASGAPLFSGIVSGIVGGIVVGILSKSHTSVSGPAAGLAAVVLSAINELQVFEVFLAAVVISGFIQLIMGFAKAGFIANYIPNNVIKGLLAAIGLILILKQIPHAIGFDKDPEDDFTFLQTDGENTFSEIFNAFEFITPGAVIISILSLLVLIYYNRTPLKNLTFFPASLFVVLFGVLLNFIFLKISPILYLQPSHLVNIPKIDLSDLSSYFHLPKLEYLTNTKVWVVAFTIAIIASLETLLNIEAVDKLDPHKRDSPPNRELLAQGAGNIISGLFGGIPVTSVIVRSSVNIQTGNETKLSTIFHGIIMLISVLILTPYLQLIPLASLAAILIITGYKLVSPALIKNMYNKGLQQFIPFAATILAIVFTDLLSGVVIGLVISIFFILKNNFEIPFRKENSNLHVGEVIKLTLPNQVSFFNKALIKQTLWDIPKNSKVIIEASYADFIHPDVLEIIDDYKTVVAKENDIQLNIVGLRDQYNRKDYIEFINILDKETQQKLMPSQVLEQLKEGNERFINGKGSDKYHLHQIDATATEQNPMAVLVGCIDSRTSPEMLFDSGIGDLLTVRIAGNIITKEIIGSLEIAVIKLGAKLIVIKGHSGCGAVMLSMNNVMSENMHTVTSKILKVATDAGLYPVPEGRNASEVNELVTKKNTINSLNEVLLESPYLKEKIESGEVGIVAAYHDVTTGKVHFEPMS